MEDSSDRMKVVPGPKGPLRTDPESHPKWQPSAYSDYAIWLI
jgi:hypothetical protein